MRMGEIMDIGDDVPAWAEPAIRLMAEAARFPSAAATTLADSIHQSPVMESVMRAAEAARFPSVAATMLADSMNTSAAFDIRVTEAMSSMVSPEWAKGTAELVSALGGASASESSSWLTELANNSESAIGVERLAASNYVSPWAVAGTGLAEFLKTPEWAESAAYMTEWIKTPAWAESAARMAKSMAAVPEWAAQTVELAESVQASGWTAQATNLLELAGMSAWGTTAHTLSAVLDDPGQMETTEVEVQRSPPYAADAIVKKPLSHEIKAAAWCAGATYVAAAVALHLSNFLSTKDPVFDPHQFFSDEFNALGVALAVFCAILAYFASRENK